MKNVVSLFYLVLGLVVSVFIGPAVDAKTVTLKELRQSAAQAANKYGVDVSLAYAIIKQESAWQSKVTSKAGAIGIMQIMPATGKSFCNLSKKELFDHEKNLDCGMRYFSEQLKRFGSVKLALCAYNAGPHRVAKKGRCPRFKETMHYVHNIITDYENRQTIITPTQLPLPHISTTQPSTAKPTDPSPTNTENAYCQYFPEDCSPSLVTAPTQTKPSTSQKSDREAKMLYCHYFPEDCQTSFTMESMPIEENAQFTNPYGLYCSYFPNDQDCR